MDDLDDQRQDLGDQREDLGNNATDRNETCWVWYNDPKRTLGPLVKEGRVGSYLVEDVLLKLYMKTKA